MKHAKISFAIAALFCCIAGAVEIGPIPAGDPAKDVLAKDKPWVPGWCRWDWRAAWVGMHKGFIQNNKNNAGKIDVVFFGDSLTMGWKDGVKALNPSLNIANYGIGGDSTRQILYRVLDGELDGISPRLVVLAIGTNNLYDDANGGSDAEIAKGIEACVKAIRAKAPSAKILIGAIVPRQNDWFCGRAKKINAETAMLDDGKTVRVLNMWDDFFDSASTDPNCRVKKELFDKDLLHLSQAGYAQWAKSIQPLFNELTK